MRNEAGKATPIDTFFPAATEADGKYLDHLNVKIDLHDHGADSIKIETAAKDAHGSPLLMKSWSNNKVETIQPVAATVEKVQPVSTVNVDVAVAEAIRSKVEAVAQPKVSVATTTITAKTTDSVL